MIVLLTLLSAQAHPLSGAFVGSPFPETEGVVCGDHACEGNVFWGQMWLKVSAELCNGLVHSVRFSAAHAIPDPGEGLLDASLWAPAQQIWSTMADMAGSGPWRRIGQDRPGEWGPGLRSGEIRYRTRGGIRRSLQVRQDLNRYSHHPSEPGMTEWDVLFSLEEHRAGRPSCEPHAEPSGRRTTQHELRDPAGTRERSRQARTRPRAHQRP